MKTCYRCKIDKELDEFNKDSKKKDGLNLYCKGCLKEMKAEKKITEEILEKKCKCCLEIKVINEFNLDRGKKDNYNIYCKKCVKEKNENSISKNKIENITEKICIKCNETKNILNFHINKKSKDGYYIYCKLCTINITYNIKNNEKKECAKCKIEKNIGLFVENKDICQLCIYLEKQEIKRINEEDKTKKICVKCKQVKNINNFNKNKIAKDKLCHTCKDCLKINYIQWKPYMLSYTKEYYKKNKEKCLNYYKKYRLLHKEELMQYAKIYRINNKDKRIIYNKQNKNYIYKKYKEYYIKHKVDLRIKMNVYIKNRYKNDKEAKKNHFIRTELRRLLFSKIDSYSKLLKFTKLELKEWLSFQFTEEMNFDNYGKLWNIDHVIPLRIDKDNKYYEYRTSLYNLKPIIVKENIIKSNKFNEDDIIKQKNIYLNYINN